MDQITITRAEFHEAVAAEIKSLIESSQKVDASPVAGLMATMLVTTFGAALTARLFKNKEEEEDGADS